MVDSEEYRPNGHCQLRPTDQANSNFKYPLLKGPVSKCSLWPPEVPLRTIPSRQQTGNKHIFTYAHRESQEEGIEILPSHPGVHCGKTSI
jgi:hypothetical protein